MSQEMAGAIPVHTRDILLSSVLCGLFCHWWNSEATGRGLCPSITCKEAGTSKGIGIVCEASSDWLLCSRTYPEVEWEWFSGGASRSLPAFKSHSLFVRFKTVPQFYSDNLIS